MQLRIFMVLSLLATSTILIAMEKHGSPIARNEDNEYLPGETRSQRHARLKLINESKNWSPIIYIKLDNTDPSNSSESRLKVYNDIDVESMEDVKKENTRETDIWLPTSDDDNQIEEAAYGLYDYWCKLWQAFEKKPCPH